MVRYYFTVKFNPFIVLFREQITLHVCSYFRNMWSVWRTVLEENEKLSKARLAAIEVFLQQIADDAKVLRMHKLQTTKKVCRPTSFRIICNPKR